MKTNIISKIGGADEPATTVRYQKAKITKKKITLTGTATCQGKSWNVEHVYFIPAGSSAEDVLQSINIGGRK